MQIEPFKMPNTEKSHDSTGKTLLTYWPIILPVSIALLSLGGIFSELRTISESLKRQESQYTVLADRQNQTGQTIIQLSGRLDLQGADISRNAQAITEVRGRLDLLSDKARWAPK
jgi:hypothetical protein